MYAVFCGSVERCMQCFVVLLKGVCSVLWSCLNVCVLFLVRFEVGSSAWLYFNVML